MAIKTLFVDDEKSLLDQTEIFLEKRDEEIEILTTSSAERALKMMEEEDLDVIVSDYQMPDIDGLEFLEEIREEKGDEIPFIMFTGKGREKVAVKALNLGADRYIQKGGDPKSQYGVLADAIKQEYEHFQSERKYRTVVENSHDAIYIYRGNEFLFVNDQAVEITGYSREELHDMKVWDLLHPEDRELVEEIGEKRDQGEDIPSEYNARIITKDGETKYLRLTVTPIDFRGQKAFLGSAMNITDLKEEQGEKEEYIQELKFIQEAVMEVSRMESINEICDYIAERIHSLNEDSYIGVSLFNREREAITLRALSGMEDVKDEIKKFFTEDLKSMSIRPKEMSERAELYTTGNLEKIPDGLYGLSEEKIPEDMCREIEDILGIDEVLTVGFALGNEPYGGIIILKGEESELRHESAIETLASHLSIVLRKKQDEKRQRLSDFSLEQASLEIYWITPEGRFIFTNETVSEKLGYSKEELQDMHVWDVDPNHGKDIRGERWEKLKEEKVLTFESEHETRDGEIYPVEITSNYLKFDGREHEFAYAEDISERKRREDELREERNLIEQIAETSPVCITKVDKNGDITYANDRAEDILGLSKSEIKGRSYDDIEWKITDYEDGELPNEKLPLELVKEKGEAVYDVRHAIERPDGERKLLSINAAPLYDEEENFDGMVAVIEDVTEKVEKKRELKESRRRLKTLMNNIPGIAYRCLNNKDWTMRFISEGCYEMTGYETEELMGEDGVSYAELIHPNDRDYVWEKVQEAVEKDEPFEIEYRIETSSGEEKWVWERGKAVESEGESEYLEGIITDITERKEMEDKIKQRMSAVEASIDGIAILDDDETYTYLNERHAQIYSYDSPDELIGETWRILYDEEELERFENEIMPEIRKGGEWRGEAVGIKKDGTEFPQELSLTALEDGGLICIVRDITDRKETEERLEEKKNKIKRLHEISAELQTYESEDDVYSFAIKAAEDILDFDKCAINAPGEDEMKAIVTSSEFPNEAVSGDKPLPIDDSLAGRTHLEKRSFLVKDKEKNDDVNPTSDDFESGLSIPIGEYAVFQAVSTEEGDYDEDDLKMGELLMRHVSEALQRIKMKEREEFLHSLLRHDVRNKNQIIEGYLELMKEHDLPEELKNLVKKTENTVYESMNIIEKSRKLWEIEEEEDIYEVDPCSMIDQVLSEYQDQLEEKGIDIEVNRCDCKVTGGSLLKELFSNLIENSIQHSNCSEISISARTEEDECIVTIQDDGEGISDEMKEKIFERKFKGEESAGTGLGLYMVKEITKSYGGSVEVKDSELGGARFDIHLKKINS